MLVARIGHGIKQHGGGDGLDQKAIDLCVLLWRVQQEHFTAVGGHHDDQRCGLCAHDLADAQAGLPAVHVRHLPIHKYRLVSWLVGLGTVADQCDGLGTVARHIHLPAPGPRHGSQNIARMGVVVDHQYPQWADQAQWRRLGISRVQRQRRGSGQGQGEMKGAAQPGLAVEREVAAHQVNQALADGQPQPGATKSAGGGCLGLRETVKNMALIFRGNTNAAVGHREAQCCSLGRLVQHLDLN